MEPIPITPDEMYRERIQRARRTPIEQKFRDGAELFETSLEFMLAGIRGQFPTASETDVRVMLRQRLDVLRQLKES